MNHDALGGVVGALLFAIILVMVIAVVLGFVDCITDSIWGYDLPDLTITATVTHMDIDDGRYKVSVSGEDFSKVLTVTSEVYASLQVGDVVEILRTGHNSPLMGDQYSYKIVR